MPELREGSRVTLGAAMLLDGQDGRDDRISVRFVRAGQTTPIRGFPKGVVFTAEALRQGVSDGMFDGAAVFFQHVEGGRDVRDLAGVTSGAVFDEESGSVVGTVHLYGNGAGQELQALAGDFRRHREQGIAHPDVGVSIDSFFVFERDRGGVPRAVRMSHLSSVDVVFRPAADGRILAEQGGSAMLTSERVEELLEEHGVTGEVRRVLMSAEYADEESLIEAIQAALDEYDGDGDDGDASPSPAPARAAAAASRDLH